MRSLHVALVENDPSLNRAYARVLRGRGHTVAAYLSAEAFLAGGEPAPACLVLDIDLDGMSGLALQRLLRANDNGIPIIFITGGDDDHAEAQARAQGCQAFIRKPFTAARLDQAIGDALA